MRGQRVGQLAKEIAIIATLGGRGGACFSSTSILCNGHDVKILTWNRSMYWII